MDTPKELIGMAPGKYDYPLADVSHLSEKRKGFAKTRDAQAEGTVFR